MLNVQKASTSQIWSPTAERAGRNTKMNQDLKTLQLIIAALLLAAKVSRDTPSGASTADTVKWAAETAAMLIKEVGVK